MSAEASGKGLLLKADPIAAAFRDEVKRSLAECPKPPKLVGILATSSAPSKFYAEFTRKQCEELGVEFILKKTGAALSSDQGEGDGVEEAIIEANEDDSVHGIMVRTTLSVHSNKVGIYPLKGVFPYFRRTTGLSYVCEAYRDLIFMYICC